MVPILQAFVTGRYMASTSAAKETELNLTSYMEKENYNWQGLKSAIASTT